MIRVIIADDHAIVRQGIKQILNDTPDVQVICEAGSAADALRQLEKNPCDVLLLDISMPGRGGIDVLRQMKSDGCRARALVFSMYPESQYAVRALRAGAWGYITKDSAPSELVAAIHKVASGHKYISPFLAEQLADRLDQDNDKPLHESLSDREFQVMRLLASGESATDIGLKLHLSVKTISTYRRRILTKLHLENNAQLILHAVELGLVTT